MSHESASLGGPAAGATNAPSLPATADRATFQAELDRLRVREKAHTREGDAIAVVRRRLPMVRPPGHQWQSGRADAPSPSGRDSKPDALTTSAPAMTAARTTAAAALTMTLGLAAACWVVSVRQMTGMDMGVATRLGSFAFFAAVWMAMMAAMMLPGAAPAVARAARAGGARRVPLFAGPYLAVWALAGAVVFAAYRPHGTAAAGAVTIAAGAYEFTPLKRHFRRRCRETAGSGFGFGLCCVGSSAGLMAMLVVLGVMSVGWMAVIAVLVTAQKLLPPRAALDVPLALTIVAFGLLIIVDPSWVPGLTPPM